jgi:hypothetical protein
MMTTVATFNGDETDAENSKLRASVCPFVLFVGIGIEYFVFRYF